MNIVIVDDAKMIRDRIKESFESIKNIEIVGEANNGIDGLDIINKTNPDFVLLDFRMPGLNGIEVIKKLKENNCKAKISIFTSYPYPQYRKKCLEEGADYFFDKTVDLQNLKNLIMQLSKEAV